MARAAFLKVECDTRADKKQVSKIGGEAINNDPNQSGQQEQKVHDEPRDGARFDFRFQLRQRGGASRGPTQRCVVTAILNG
jgi:hypothetical protein